MNKERNSLKMDVTRKVPVFNVRMMTDDEWNRLAYKNFLQRTKKQKN